MSRLELQLRVWSLGLRLRSLWERILLPRKRRAQVDPNAWGIRSFNERNK